MKSDLKAIVYHEAGHVVAGYIYGRRFKRVSIKTSKKSRGSVSSGECEPNNEFERLGCDGFVEFYDGEILEYIFGMDNPAAWLTRHPEERARVLRAIRSMLAGFIAQDIGVPGSVKEEMWEEDKRIIKLLGFMLGPDVGDGLWELVTHVRADIKENWNLVERLAEVLLTRKTLSEEEVLGILNNQQPNRGGNDG